MNQNDKKTLTGWARIRPRIPLVLAWGTNLIAALLCVAAVLFFLTIAKKFLPIQRELGYPDSIWTLTVRLLMQSWLWLLFPLYSIVQIGLQWHFQWHSAKWIWSSIFHLFFELFFLFVVVASTFSVLSSLLEALHKS